MSYPSRLAKLTRQLWPRMERSNFEALNCLVLIPHTIDYVVHPYLIEAVTIRRDKQEITLWRRRLQEVFFSIEVQVPIDGVKRNCLLSI